MFNKPVSDISTTDLAELLIATPLESVRLEFKRMAPGPDELVKKLSGFANTFGGYLIVGAEERDGRLSALPGIESRPDYRQTITQQCANAIVPLIDVFVSDPIASPVGDGKVCYVIHVPESDRTPHFLNGRRGAYVRIDEHSHRVADKLATYEEIMQLADRRKRLADQRGALVSRAKGRFTRFASQLTPRDDGLPRASAMIVVIPRYPSSQLVDHAKLMQIARDVRVGWRSGNFPREHTPLSQHESALLPTEYERGQSLVEINSWGLVASAWTIEHAVGQLATPIGIHLRYLLGMVLVHLEYANKIQQRMGFEGPLQIIGILERIRGVPLYGFHHNSPEEMAVSRFDDAAQLSINTTTERLRSERDNVAMELMQALLFALGWPGTLHPDDMQAQMSLMISGAYEYNFWPQPT
jgi:hypothetical protein